VPPGGPAGPGLPAWDARRAVPLVVAAVAPAGVALGPAGVAIAGATAVVAVPVQRALARSRRRQLRRAQLPDALERVAAALRSGSSLPGALDEAGQGLPDPLGAELTGLAGATRRGQPIAAALDDWAAARGDAATRAAATVLVVASTAGAAPARAVDGVAATLRERARLAAERRALAAQARWSSLVLSATPLVVAVLLGLTGSAAGRFLFRTPAGWACLAGGVAIDALGAWWTASLTRGTDP
jgi:tight adherence protein B